MNQIYKRRHHLGVTTVLGILGLAQAQTTQPVQYIFAHGLNRACDAFFGNVSGGAIGGVCTTPTVGSLADKIRTGQTGNLSPVFGQTVNTTSQGIATQAQTFLNGMNSAASSLPRVVVGHSQGTLRSRFALQRLPGGTNNVLGFIGISGPQAGAPITVNTAPFVRAAIADLRTSGLGGITPDIVRFLINIGQIPNGSLLTTIPDGVYTNPDTAINFVESNLGFTTSSPGIMDMNPGSTFLSNINNLVGCYWVFNGWFYQVCNYVNGGPLPTTVAVASIVGKNNKFWDGLVSSNNPSFSRSNANTAMGAVRAYAYSQQAGCNGSFRLWQAACDSWFATLRLLDKTEDLDRSLNTLVGSTEGDGVVPLSSQDVYSASPYLGGRNVALESVDQASHDWENSILGKNETMIAMRRIQGLMGIPQSR